MGMITVGYVTGANLYATVQRESDGAYWRTSTFAFEAFNAANWADYDTALTENGVSGTYAAAFPAGITTAGLYRVEARLRAGGSPAVGDVILGDELWDWSGTTRQSISNAVLGLTLSLTAPQVQAAASAAAGDGLILWRGDTWEQAITGLGALTGWLEIWFTLKKSKDDADSAARVLIKATVGLVYLNGATATAGQGSLTIDDLTAGDVTITLTAAAAANLAPKAGYHYDLQVRDASGIRTLTEGRLTVVADVTQAVS